RPGASAPRGAAPGSRPRGRGRKRATGPTAGQRPAPRPKPTRAPCWRKGRARGQSSPAIGRPRGRGASAPRVVSSPQRSAGWSTMRGRAWLVCSLIEREARRARGPAAKVPPRRAGHVAARPPGEMLLQARREIARATVASAGQRYPRVAEGRPLPHTLLALLGGPEHAYARVAASSS